jgi:hypothetical protein
MRADRLTAHVRHMYGTCTARKATKGARLLAAEHSSERTYMQIGASRRKFYTTALGLGLLIGL